MFLLDTCVISDFVKGEEETVKKIKSHSPTLFCVSVITLMEIEYGLEQSPSHRTKLGNVLTLFLNSIQVLNFRAQEAHLAAKIRNDLKSKGTPIGPYDILIGATALTNDLILITSNEKEFNRIRNLEVINWRNAT